MNIPAGKIIIGLFLVMVIVLGIALVAGSGESPSAPSIPAAEPSPTLTPSPIPSPSPTSPATPSASQYNWEITNLRYKITEKGENYWYFSWQATIKNNTFSSVEFFVHVNFVDKDGFIIDWTIETLVLNPKEQRSIKGTEMIEAELASGVKRAELGEVSVYTKD